MMKIAHLTASTFFGGPERQMIGLAREMREQSAFFSFAEGGRCRSFLDQVRKSGFQGIALKVDTPRLRAAASELTGHLKGLRPDVLCCHGYKANILGRIAARRCSIPAVAVARGWTGESRKVRFYEMLDRFHLRWMDHVVCVSAAQAAKVRRAGVGDSRVTVITNAVDPTRFTESDQIYRNKLLRSFRSAKTAIVGAAGRLSPEKGFDILIEAANIVQRKDPKVGFALFGAGTCRDQLTKQIMRLGLGGTIVLNGFRADLDRFIPAFDLLALPSHTEGLPNVILEAFAAGVPVVATAVGGTPEIVRDGENGYLVPAASPAALAEKILLALSSPERLREMSNHGRETVANQFTFSRQAAEYRRLFNQLCGRPISALSVGNTSGITADRMSVRESCDPTEAFGPGVDAPAEPAGKDSDIADNALPVGCSNAE